MILFSAVIWEAPYLKYDIDMRVLTFTLGPHRLALKTDHVNSVSRHGTQTALLKSKEKKDLPAIKKINLAEILNINVSSSDRIINCSYNGKPIELMVEKILGLVESGDEELMAWPALLKKVSIFSGIIMVNSDIYLLLDITKISSVKEASFK